MSTACPRVVIAGAHSGAGKTTVATGLMAALTQRGYRVQGYKVGPDYIDPGYHTPATGRPARNLDGWMVPPPALLGLFAKAAAGADLAVIEGVMGLFDGSACGEEMSTAGVAKLLGAPVVLVVDGHGLAESAAALVWGYKNFDPNLNLAGVIFNRVGSSSHAGLLKRAVEEKAGVKVLGCLPRTGSISVPERHLGLLPAAEKKDTKDYIGRLGEAVAQSVDLEEIVRIARAAPRLPPSRLLESAFAGRADVRLAVAVDAAFHFYYRDSLDTLETCGAELVYFSPLRDRALPLGVHGLYIGGGFPEAFLEELVANEEMKEDIRAAHRRGMPIYAECGGLLYLAEEIRGFDGRRYPAAGVIPVKVRFLEKLAALGYARAEVLNGSILAQKGETIRGHVFHYSVCSEPPPHIPRAYSLWRPGGEHIGTDGFVLGNTLATYLHVNFAGCPRLAENFVASMRRHKAAAGAEGGREA